MRETGEEIRNELARLEKDGEELLNNLQTKPYQKWFSIASRVVKDLLPERHNEFIEFYHNKLERFTIKFFLL